MTLRPLFSCSVGSELVQAGAGLYRDTEVEVEQIEDSLITGLLRERLLQVRIGATNEGMFSDLWLSVFSHCPWLSLTKLTFSNHLVISKSSSRKHVQYVGGIRDTGLWRWVQCTTS